MRVATTPLPGVGSDSTQARIFRKALRYIDEHIGDETQCPEWLVTQVGVCVRGLYRLFSRHSLVVAQYVKNRRLDLCAEQLRHARGEGKLCALGYEWALTIRAIFPRRSRRALALRRVSIASAT
jgi:AraC family transcriptional activator of tynA and feaB